MLPESMLLMMRDFLLALSVLGIIASLAAFRNRGHRARAEGLLFAFEYKVFELTLPPESCFDEIENWPHKAIAYCRHLIDHEEFKEAIVCMESCLDHLNKLSSL